MAEIFIEDKYYEAKLADGSTVYTKTSYIVNALKYYRNQCLKIIENSEKEIKGTPRLMVVESFEAAIKKIDQMTNAQVRIRKAHDLMDKIDGILRRMASPQQPSGPQNN